MRKAKKKAKRKPATLWSKDEVKLLEKLYPTGLTREISDRTGRSPASVRYKAFRMGIKRKRVWQACPDWPADELKLLKKLYPTTKNREIATRLGCSMRRVRYKAFFLGLQKKTQSKPRMKRGAK